MPKLGLFSAAHPHIYVRISAAMEHVSFDQGDIDVAIRHGNGDWPHLQVQRLRAEMLFSVCSPSLFDGRDYNAGCNPQQIPSDATAPEAPLGADLQLLNAATLLHDRDRRVWQRWLRELGVDPLAYDTDRGPVFSQMSWAIDAAAVG